MIVTVNGREQELPAPASLAQLLARVLDRPDAAGIAVAVNGAVVVRSAHAAHALVAGDRVEIVTAVQGG